jgi:hypothetical protein
MVIHGRPSSHPGDGTAFPARENMMNPLAIGIVPK